MYIPTDMSIPVASLCHFLSLPTSLTFQPPSPHALPESASPLPFATPIIYFKP